MKNKLTAGFTLVETLLVLGISGIFLLLVTSVIIRGFSNLNLTQQDMGTRSEINLALYRISRDFFNSVFLHPTENLIPQENNQFLAYQGVQGLRANHLNFSGLPAAVQACRSTVDTTTGREQFSIVYMTVLGTEIPERLLAAWNENQTGLTNEEFRATQHPGASGYPFQVAAGATEPATPILNLPHEILLIDGTGMSTRRYRVNGATSMRDTRDPADYLIDKSPKIFEYTTARLLMPNTLSGGSQTNLPLGFVPNSLIYGIKTSILCSTNDDKIVRINAFDGTTETLFDGPLHQFALSRFEITYFNATPGTRLDRALFLPFPLPGAPGVGTVSIANSKSLCINAARIQVELKNKKPGAPQIPLIFDRINLLFNHNSHRPAGC